MRDHTRRVPLHVESLQALCARYPAAVVDLVDQLEVQQGKREQPSENPKHVFDTPAGWRLIISRERMPTGEIGVHLSASIHDDDLHRRMQEHTVTAADAVIEIIDLWKTLAQSKRQPMLIGVSDGGVPHFWIEQMS